MTPMISTILLELALIEPIISITWFTTCPPCAARCEAVITNSLAWRAFSAFCLTVWVSSSIELAVSSSEPACASVRDDKSALPSAISPDAVVIAPIPTRTCSKVVVKLIRISSSARDKSPISSLARVATLTVKSPWAMLCARSTALYKGRVMLFESSAAHATPHTKAAPAKASSSMRLVS